MQTTAAGSSGHISTDFNVRVINGRPDFEFAAALQKVSPQQQTRAKSTAVVRSHPATLATESPM